jgi:hypothetical protein
MFDACEVVVCDTEIDWKMKRKSNRMTDISNGTVSVRSKQGKLIVIVLVIATVLVCSKSILSRNQLGDQ